MLAALVLLLGCCLVDGWVKAGSFVPLGFASLLAVAANPAMPPCNWFFSPSQQHNMPAQLKIHLVYKHMWRRQR